MTTAHLLHYFIPPAGEMWKLITNLSSLVFFLFFLSAVIDLLCSCFSAMQTQCNPPVDFCPDSLATFFSCVYQNPDRVRLGWWDTGKNPSGPWIF
ncbi:hypothetical protein XELAEV_18039146mg [Xenopus laevis]|uniref:Uncharacterized protein n=1 Tax=Xenopus laevis TaxID=8355 RepID=A0A974C7D3_XENLA|nr:hypothetical protein XELAEV_18039146mg [Xenopus laevis]